MALLAIAAQSLLLYERPHAPVHGWIEECSSCEYFLEKIAGKVPHELQRRRAAVYISLVTPGGNLYVRFVPKQDLAHPDFQRFLQWQQHEARCSRSP